MFPKFWAPFLVVLKDLIAATVSGASILPTKFLVDLKPLYNSLAVSRVFVDFNKFLVAPANLPTPKLFAIVLVIFAAFKAVFAPAAGANAPPLNALAPANTTSSTAILPIIPKV